MYLCMRIRGREKTKRKKEKYCCCCWCCWYINFLGEVRDRSFLIFLTISLATFIIMLSFSIQFERVSTDALWFISSSSTSFSFSVLLSHSVLFMDRYLNSKVVSLAISLWIIDTPFGKVFSFCLIHFKSIFRGRVHNTVALNMNESDIIVLNRFWFN